MRFAEQFHHEVNLPQSDKMEAEKLMFIELSQSEYIPYTLESNHSDRLAVCLWGNSTDLSLLINMTEEQIKSLQSTGGDALAETEKNILGNHMERLWEIVRDSKARSNETTNEQNGAKRKGGRIDFVLDNAGFELYCDCVFGESGSPSLLCLILRCCDCFLADFLLQTGYATEIHFHGKRYPWFVSDVTMKDWAWLLNTMNYGHLFPKATPDEMESLRRMGKRWKVRSRELLWPIYSHPSILAAIRERGQMDLRSPSFLVHRVHFLGSS